MVGSPCLQAGLALTPRWLRSWLESPQHHVVPTHLVGLKHLGVALDSFLHFQLPPAAQAAVLAREDLTHRAGDTAESMGGVGMAIGEDHKCGSGRCQVTRGPWKSTLCC